MLYRPREGPPKNEREIIRCIDSKSDLNHGRNREKGVDLFLGRFLLRTWPPGVRSLRGRYGFDVRESFSSFQLFFSFSFFCGNNWGIILGFYTLRASNKAGPNCHCPEIVLQGSREREMRGYVPSGCPKTARIALIMGWKTHWNSSFYPRTSEVDNFKLLRVLFYFRRLQIRKWTGVLFSGLFSNFTRDAMYCGSRGWKINLWAHKYETGHMTALNILKLT